MSIKHIIINHSGTNLDNLIITDYLEEKKNYIENLTIKSKLKLLKCFGFLLNITKFWNAYTHYSTWFIPATDWAQLIGS